MRVCMFAMLLPAHATGGMENHALDLARGLAKAGHEVTLISSRHPSGLEREAVGGVEIHYTLSEPTSRHPLGEAAIEKFLQLNEANKFDVVHSQSVAAARLVKTGLKRKLDIPLVTTMHGTSYLEVRSALRQGPSLKLLPRVAFQLWCHQFRVKPLMAESDAVIAVSDAVAESLRGEFALTPPKLRMVYNGIDVTEFAPGASSLKGRFKGRSLILSVSALHSQKGVQHLIAAHKIVKETMKDAHLLIVGDGPYRVELEKLTARLGLRQDVTFEGRVPHESLRDYYRGCDVFVLASFGVEGLPLSLLEAMACGRPCVASDLGGIPSALKDRVNGLLFKPKDVGGLAEKIMSVLCDPASALRLGAAARRTVEERFSREKMVYGTVAVYEGVIA
jgi:glycosyltransferase involved in cell wall biosynthesis